MRIILPLTLAGLALSGCGDSVDPDKLDALESAEETEPRVPQVVEPTPGEPEELVDASELETDENVPSLAEVQSALAQCEYEEDVIDATCTASEEGAEFTCSYVLEGDLPETAREAFIAADGTSYTLIDIPEDCPVQ